MSNFPKEPLTNKQVEDLLFELGIYLMEKEGCDIRIFYEYNDPRRGRRVDRLYAETNFIDSILLGDFAFIINEYRGELLIWLSQEEDGEIKFVAQPGFRYTHPGGGSNGHNFRFRIAGKVGQRWDEFEKWE